MFVCGVGGGGAVADIIKMTNCNVELFNHWEKNINITELMNFSSTLRYELNGHHSQPTLNAVIFV